MHVYLHVPFCGRRCSYCDFAIAVRSATPDAAYRAAIEAEWRQRLADDRAAVSQPVRTVYFGGGTPSRLQPETIAALIGCVAGRRLDARAEVTLEANPDDVSVAAAEGWAAAGINRVSLGVQSHYPAALSWMHRTHRAEQVRPAVAALRAAGLDNISIDLIFALPTEIERDWRDDVLRTAALEPRHISVYGLTTEPATPLARWAARGEVTPVPDSRYADEFIAAHELLGAAGFEHYEVSNLAQPGFRSRHNSAYWSGAEYIGLGPSAHSFAGGRRTWNVREWAAYQRRFRDGASVVEGWEDLDGARLELEHRYLGLRTDDGVDADAVPAGRAAEWCRAGWATRGGGRVRLSPEGWLRLDALVAGAANS